MTKFLLIEKNIHELISGFPSISTESIGIFNSFEEANSFKTYCEKELAIISDEYEIARNFWLDYKVKESDYVSSLIISEKGTERRKFNHKYFRPYDNVPKNLRKFFCYDYYVYLENWFADKRNLPLKDYFSYVIEEVNDEEAYLSDVPAIFEEFKQKWIPR